jgi:hypothetical protein
MYPAGKPRWQHTAKLDGLVTRFMLPVCFQIWWQRHHRVWNFEYIRPHCSAMTMASGRIVPQEGDLTRTPRRPHLPPARAGRQQPPHLFARKICAGQPSSARFILNLEEIAVLDHPQHWRRKHWRVRGRRKMMEWDTCLLVVVVHVNSKFGPCTQPKIHT